VAARNAAELRIRQLRLERRWTQQELAEQIARMAWLRRRERVGVNADMVAKWERGAKGVSARYVELLCLLFGVQASAIGFADNTASRERAAMDEPASVLAETLGKTAALLDQLGSEGAVLHSKMLNVWKDEIMLRRSFLKLVSLAPAPGLAGHRSPKASGTRPTPDTLRDLDQLAGRYQVLYHSVAPVALLMPVVAHLDTVRDLLRQSPGPSIRRRLLANRARVGILAGRLSFFDSRDPMAARGYYNLALEAAQEAPDHHQTAAALGHIAFIPAADFGFTAAVDYLCGANQQLRRRPHDQLSSWLAAVESELQTNAGQHSAAFEATDRARDQLARRGLPEALPWFDYYDEVRLAGFAGYANLRAGRTEKARTALTDALTHLPGTAVKQRAVFSSPTSPPCTCVTETSTRHAGQQETLQISCARPGTRPASVGSASFGPPSSRGDRLVRSARWTTSSPPSPDPRETHVPIRAVWFDVGEALIDESREYGTWADWLGVPRHTFSAVFGAAIARGEDYREVFQYFRPGFDLDKERQARLDAGLGEYFNASDLYPDVRPCLESLREAGYFIGIAGNQTARAGRFIRELNLPADIIATSDDWGVNKPDEAFFHRMVDVSVHRADEIAYVGDRLDNDIAPAAKAGLATVWIARGPWGRILRPRDIPVAPTIRLESLGDLPRALAAQQASR